MYTANGNIQLARLKRAISIITAHHHSLRTCFFPRPGTGEPVQALLASPRDCFKHVKDEDGGALDREVEIWRNHVWELSEGDVLRVILVTHAPEEHSLIIAYHHIAFDGVSMHIFLRGLNAVYMGNKLDTSAKQYMDISAEERAQIESGSIDQRIAYWTQMHTPPADTLPLFPFARVKSRPIPESYRNVESFADIGDELSGQVKKASHALRVTPFYFYMTALQALFNRLLGVEDLCIGVTDANRTEKSSQAIGFFLNLLPLRFTVQKEVTFTDLVKRTTEEYRTAQANSGVPFDVVLDRANVPRESTHTPLFQVAMNYRQGNFSKIPLGGCTLQVKEGLDAQSPYDLAFSITPNNETTFVQIVAREDLYEREGTDTLMSAYLALLKDASKDVNKNLESYNLYDQGSVDRALSLGNGGIKDYEWPSTLTEKVEQAMRENGPRVAIKDVDTEITYAELATATKNLASALVSKLQPGSSVAVLCEPTMAWAISMLAVIRAGMIYIPLDGKLPDERLAAILEASKPDLILFEDATEEHSQKLAGSIPVLSSDSASGNSEAPNMERVDDATFILFTSGSTGTPKGIKLSSQGIINYVATKSSKLSLGCEIVLQQSALGFDMSLAQAFIALTLGGTLVIAPAASRGDPQALGKLMVAEKVTFTLGTPTEYLMLIRHGGEAVKTASFWRNATSGGEAITSQLKAAFRSLHNAPVLTDCYGPTEISCCATIQTVDIHSGMSGEANSSGKANPNTSIYIVDESGRSVPPGIPGEICVGGVGVGLGYLDKDISAQKFITNPFVTPEERLRGWTSMYRTGDKGLIRADGGLQFMGRMDGDTTIKLRGLRIDLDDVTNTMLLEGKGSFADAIVTVRGDPAFLVAHVVLASGSSASSEDLQQLANSLPLPQYMKPAIVIPLEQLPLSNNGKIDRRVVENLPLPTVTSSSNSQTLVSSGRKPTLAEGEMRLIWHKVLSQTGLISSAKLEPDTDFFHVGGNSLLLIKLQSAIQTSMGVSLSLREMYRSSTLEGITILATERDSGQFVSETINWEAETVLPRSITINEVQTLPPRTGHGLEILMTGSLAFLGSRILRSLLGDPAVARVHCVAVDPDSMEKHIEDDRVTLYPGSLSEAMFGLSSDTYHQLQRFVDVIILAGSEGHCLNNYSTLRAPNVTSTQQMGRFAYGRRIPIHYISSNRVTLLDDSANAALPPVSVKDHRPLVDGSEGFTAAKWASEVFLENLSAAAMNSSGSNHSGYLPVTIHRHCAIVGEEAPIEDALNALLRYSKLIAAVPKVSNLNVNGYFDFLPVESVASDIATSVVSSQTAQVGVEFRHYSSGTRVTPGEFASYMQKTYGSEFREIELEDWIEEARKEGIEELIVLYLQAIVERGGKITFPYMGNTV